MSQTITIVDDTATKMTPPTSHSEGRMWPSLETATRLFDAFSIALAIGACVVFVATAAIVWLGIVKEHHWDELREQARNKVATLETETARANVEVARAHENTAKLSVEAEAARAAIADANARAAEAQLALAKYKQPRMPDREKFLKQIASGPKSKFEVVYVKECSDCFFLGMWIVAFLEEAGWTNSNFSEINVPPDTHPSIMSLPAAMLVKGQSWGVTLVAKENRDIASGTSSYGALMHALMLSLETSGAGGVDPNMPDDVIRIVVAPKA